METHTLIPAELGAHTLYLFGSGGRIWTPLLPVCRAMGVDSKGQVKRCQLRPETTQIDCFLIARPGGSTGERGKNNARKLRCVSIETLQWLASTLKPTNRSSHQKEARRFYAEDMLRLIKDDASLAALMPTEQVREAPTNLTQETMTTRQAMEEFARRMETGLRQSMAEVLRSVLSEFLDPLQFLLRTNIDEAAQKAAAAATAAATAIPQPVVLPINKTTVPVSVPGQDRMLPPASTDVDKLNAFIVSMGMRYHAAGLYPNSSAAIKAVYHHLYNSLDHAPAIPNGVASLPHKGENTIRALERNKLLGMLWRAASQLEGEMASWVGSESLPRLQPWPSANAGTDGPILPDIGNPPATGTK